VVGLQENLDASHRELEGVTAGTKHTAEVLTSTIVDTKVVLQAARKKDWLLTRQNIALSICQRQGSKGATEKCEAKVGEVLKADSKVVWAQPDRHEEDARKTFRAVFDECAKRGAQTATPHVSRNKDEFDGLREVLLVDVEGEPKWYLQICEGHPVAEVVPPPAPPEDPTAPVP
jgi:hypothetical protein